MTYPFSRAAAWVTAAVRRAGISPSLVAYASVSVVTLALYLGLLDGALAARFNQPVAISIAYLLSAVFQFYVLRYVVFKVAHKTVSPQAFAYIAGQLIHWGLSVGGVALLTRFFPLTTMQAATLCVPMLFPVNYLISRHAIFRR